MGTGAAIGARAVSVASDAVDVFRTPDERFEGLPGYDFEPQLHRDRRPAAPLRRRGARAARSSASTASRPGRSSTGRCSAPLVEARPPRDLPRLRGLRALRQADRPRLVHVRPPRRAGHEAARRARPQGRDRRRPGLGRPDRAALGGRERRAGRRRWRSSTPASSPAGSRRGSWPGGTSPRRTRTCRSAS